jgi:HlyD family secretion protein
MANLWGGTVLSRRKLWVVGSLMAALLVLSLGWTVWRAPRVDSVSVASAPLVRSVQFSARLSTLSRVEVGSAITARVESVAVREGAMVRAGQALVTLESTEVRAALAQSQATVEQARSRLEGLRLSGRTQAAASVQQSEATWTLALADLARVRQLVSQGFVSGARVDEAERSLSVAEAQRRAAFAQAQALEDSGTEIAQAQAALDVARAAAATAKARVDLTVIRAPADAQVLSRTVETGQVVQPGRVLLALAVAGPTLLKAQADERFLSDLQPGQSAHVVADAFTGQPFMAEVQSIAPLVDAQRGAVEVTLAVRPPMPTFLRQDMTLSVQVETARKSQALVLPLAVLRGPVRETAATAWVLHEGRVQERGLRLGLRNLESVEVLEGLSTGETVVVGEGVRPGERARARIVTIAAPADRPAGAGAAAALTGAMGR